MSPRKPKYKPTAECIFLRYYESGKLLNKPIHRPDIAKRMQGNNYAGDGWKQKEKERILSENVCCQQ